jgi:hypothetical protein
MLGVFWMDFVTALGVALVLTAGYAGYRRRGPLTYLPIVFLMVLLGAWAGGAWLQPLGHSTWRWLPFAAVGLVFGLVLTLATPRQPASRPAAAEQAVDEMVTLLSFRRFVWPLLFLLAVFIVLRYFTPEAAGSLTRGRG